MGERERALLLEAFDSNWLAPLGPHVDAFEAELATLASVNHAAALSSGTAALHLALLVSGVASGDQVVVSDLGFAAAVNVIRYVGATPILVDADPSSWTMDPGLLAEALEDRARRGRVPKAVIVVDLYGQCADYDRIAQVCSRYEVTIIQDAAEAVGATYKDRPAGSQGHLGVYSFNGNKIVTTSGGGALLSNRREWIDTARNLASQAREPAPHYEHRTVGYNYRMSNLLAAVGRGQLSVLADRVRARRANFDFYQERFGSRPGWSFMPEATYGRANRWLTCALIDPQFGVDRETIRLALEAQQIEARPVWKPMHLQPVFEGCALYGGAVGKRFFERGLCLPSGSSLTGADRQRVAEVIEHVHRRAVAS